MRSMEGTIRRRSSMARSETGFSLPELLVAVTILLIISSAVTSGLLQMTTSQRTIWNRTQLHAGVRSATELLQQEVGQAGRVTLPGIAVLGGDIGVTGTPQQVGITQTIDGVTAASVSGVFVNEQLTIDTGAQEETVTVTAVNTTTKQMTATFSMTHAAGARVAVFGGFASGVVPPTPGFTNGSTGTVLKLYGDINGDGKMVYVEYTCDIASGNLYRNVMPFDTATKAAPGPAQVLLGNVLANPGGTDCFTYMPNPLPVVNGTTYVLDVAITLTVQTQQKDSITHQYQTETKALLNVSPRNVFNVWQLASAGAPYTNRIQPMPATVTNLLP